MLLDVTPQLVAVDHPCIAVADGAGAQRCQIGARLRFRPRRQVDGYADRLVDFALSAVGAQHSAP